MRYLLVALSLSVMLSVSRPAQASCGDHWTFQSESYDGTIVCGPGGSFTKTVTWRIFWKDGHSEDHFVRDAGTDNRTVSPCVGCWPSFETPYFEESGTSGTWV